MDLSRRNSFYGRFGKRCFDLALALTLLPLFLPLIALVWALTRLEDRGPGFYSQKRIGLNGKIFNCWKIRTMVINAEQALQDLCDSDPEVAREWHENQKLAKDPRITRIGGFLRSSSLDELPQIWNVITGDMSFIGPRPFMTSQEHLYRQAGGESYFKVRPGITGNWQVEGRGQTTFVERISYDDSYLETLSFRRDMSLIWRTIAVIVNRTGH
ncbi:sugar transferase [Pseudooceanicola algae]|uniref:sugar transferase n=1 Tax=Pseudooceanicola algae TaxID=1537215 RepID=UPI001E39ACED|nr:sugar transferase [Pseudooceanicola algae]